jgi:hypothetical protein
LVICSVPKESGGAISVRVKAFTELGFKGGEVFRLVSTGTLQLASAVLPYTTGEVPMNEAADLVGLVGSVEELHKIADVLRPGYTKFLEEEHGIKLLGFGAYHAQVIYCRDSFTSIADLRGRKVRAAGASQQAFVNSLSGSPVASDPLRDSPARIVRRQVVVLQCVHGGAAHDDAAGRGGGHESCGLGPSPLAKAGAMSVCREGACVGRRSGGRIGNRPEATGSRGR